MVREWDDAVAFTPLMPVNSGHVLIVPREHVTDVTTNPRVSLLAMSRAIEMAADHFPCNIIVSAGREATQTIMHLHIHVVPRKANDGLTIPWGFVPHL